MSNVEPSSNPQPSPQTGEDQNSIFRPPVSPPNRDYRPTSPARMAATGAGVIACIAALAFALFNDKYEDHSVRNELESVKSMLRSPGAVNSSAGGMEIVPSAIPSPQDIARAKIETAEKIALSKAALDTFASGVVRLERKAGDLSRTRQMLVDELKQIEDSEIGRKIASQSDLVRQYSNIYNAMTEPNEISGDTLSFVSAMKEFLAKSEFSAVADFRPSDVSVARLEQLTVRVDEKLEDVSNSTKLLSAIKTSARDKVASTTSLRDVIENLQNEMDLKYLAAKTNSTTQAEEQSLAEYGSKILKSEKEKADSKHRVQVAANESDTTSNNSLAAELEENRRLKEKEARERLAYQKRKNEFDLVRSDIDTYLLPFTSPGLTHRGKHTGRGPVSYSVLVSKGAVADTASGRSRLSYLANNLNGRPKGGFPSPITASLLSHPPFAGKVQFIEKAHELIRKFHPVLIKEGLLAE